MTVSVLVTGSADRVERVSHALRAAGAQAVSVPDADGLGEVVGRMPAGSLDCYIQLPVTLRPSGDAVVSRVRDFLDKGLMNRFRMAEVIMPALSGQGRVVLVAGHTPASASAPDDEAARVGLLHVLAHAIRADKAPEKVRVRVVDARDADEIVRAALASDHAPGGAPAAWHGPAIRDEEMSYTEWRTEVLGLASIEF
jgi:hypothetical protein